MDEILKLIIEAILAGDMVTVVQGVQTALDKGLGAGDILQKALTPAMGEVGSLFENGEFFVPEMLISARSMQAGLALLKPLLVDSKVKPVGKVAIGTVKGDLHDIGKNLVAMMMEGAGFEVVDLGTDVSAEQYIDAIKEHQVDIVAMSALLTTTMPMMEKIIAAFEEAGLKDRIKFMVGGAPVTAEYAKEVNADGYPPDASQAANLARTFVV